MDGLMGGGERRGGGGGGEERRRFRNSFPGGGKRGFPEGFGMF